MSADFIPSSLSDLDGPLPATDLPAQFTPGTYTNVTIVVGAGGYVTGIANGSSGGGGLAIGTTPIAGGTSGRVLIEGSGPVVEDSAALTYAGGTLAVQSDGVHNPTSWNNTSGTPVAWVDPSGNWVSEAASGFAMGEQPGLRRIKSNGYDFWFLTDADTNATLGVSAPLASIYSAEFQATNGSGCLRVFTNSGTNYLQSAASPGGSAIDLVFGGWGGSPEWLRLTASGQIVCGSQIVRTAIHNTAAPLNSDYLSLDHLDGNGDPKLCRKGASGAVTVIG